MRRAPKYPRIPHLGTLAYADSEDRVLGLSERAALLAAPVVVEEKLDGANIALWFDDGVLHVASRGGVETRDRGGVLGRIRAWALPHSDRLRTTLGENLALYAEWLLARHAVAYSKLPAPLVGLDLLEVDGPGAGEATGGPASTGGGTAERASQPAGRFLPVPERDLVLAQAGLVPPPLVWTGVLGSADAAERLLGASAFGDGHAEGIIIRAGDPASTTVPRIAKLVRPGYRPFNPDEIGDAENRVTGA